MSASIDFGDVRGLKTATLDEIVRCVAAHEPFLLVGPPGSAKTMIARRVATILPERSEVDRRDAILLHHAAGLDPARVAAAPPFRAPHHTASVVALCGTLATLREERAADRRWRERLLADHPFTGAGLRGRTLRPGEVSLAHSGVLLLDELPEFSRRALDALRAVKRGFVTLARRYERVTLPAAPLVVAAANACACGYSGDAFRACVCSSERRAAYERRLGYACEALGIRTRIPVKRLGSRALREGQRAPSSDILRAAVARLEGAAR